MTAASRIGAPPAPAVRLHLGVTGHRETNATFAADRTRIAMVLDEVLAAIAAALASLPALPGGAVLAPTRLHTLLADGADQMAAQSALARGWELVAPLPFGRRLNAAINARPLTGEDARALIAGHAALDAQTNVRAQAILDHDAPAHVFELADQDAEVSELFLARLDAPGDRGAGQRFNALASARAALAARVMIEQSDIVIAVWDGLSRHFVGGTGHTIRMALELGAPVVWIDPQTPLEWRILHAPESLDAPQAPSSFEVRAGALAALVKDAVLPVENETSKPRHGATLQGVESLTGQAWKAHSHPLSHAYRRIEAVFGADARPFRRLRQTYETPDAIAKGSGADVLAGLRSLPGGDPQIAQAVEGGILRRFAWADGVSSRLSDIYRGAMTASFILSGSAVIAGVLYLPFVSGAQKGPFAAVEFLLLAAILAVTALGQQRRWHGRWFETRRVAEYLRHSPILLAAGVARPPGRWPRGSDTNWPEWYARHALREVGLPQIVVSPAYLRAALAQLLDSHVTRQRDYHAAKAARLTSVHRNLDRLSEGSFILAVISVALFLLLLAAGRLSLVGPDTLYRASKWFTLLGAVLPTLGAAVAGIRYFGDFERFAAISEVTAEKLDAVDKRIGLLLAGPAARITYDQVAELAHAADEIVVSEIESWQSVFGGKHVTVPA